MENCTGFAMCVCVSRRGFGANTRSRETEAKQSGRRKYKRKKKREFVIIPRSISFSHARARARGGGILYVLRKREKRKLLNHTRLMTVPSSRSSVNGAAFVSATSVVCTVIVVGIQRNPKIRDRNSQAMGGGGRKRKCGTCFLRFGKGEIRKKK